MLLTKPLLMTEPLMVSVVSAGIRRAPLIVMVEAGPIVVLLPPESVTVIPPGIITLSVDEGTMPPVHVEAVCQSPLAAAVIEEDDIIGAGAATTARSWTPTGSEATVVHVLVVELYLST